MTIECYMIEKFSIYGYVRRPEYLDLPDITSSNRVISKTLDIKVKFIYWNELKPYIVHGEVDILVIENAPIHDLILDKSFKAGQGSMTIDVSYYDPKLILLHQRNGTVVDRSFLLEIVGRDRSGHPSYEDLFKYQRGGRYTFIPRTGTWTYRNKKFYPLQGGNPQQAWMA